MILIFTIIIWLRQWGWLIAKKMGFHLLRSRIPLIFNFFWEAMADGVNSVIKWISVQSSQGLVWGELWSCPASWGAAKCFIKLYYELMLTVLSHPRWLSTITSDLTSVKCGGVHFRFISESGPRVDSKSNFHIILWLEKDNSFWTSTVNSTLAEVAL